MEHGELDRRLREIREPEPPPGLQARLEQGIPDFFERPEAGWSPRRIPMMAKLAATVAMLGGALWVSALMLLGPATPPALGAMLQPIAQATGRAGAVHLVLRMLGRPGEGFSFVNLGGEMTEVEAWIEWPTMPGDPGRMRVDRQDRVRCFDGRHTVLYLPGRREAYRFQGPGVDPELFWPAAWVRRIQNAPTPGVEIVSRDEVGDRGKLVLRERGVDTSPREPAFLGEFDRETEVEWDRTTNLLLGLKRWVLIEGEPRLFSELVSVEYLPRVPDGTFELELPPDVRWGGVRQGPLSLLDLGPHEIARALFDAARRADRETLELLCPSPATVDWLLEPSHQPIEVLFVGDPFRAGRYAGVYVPYRVRFGGRLREHDLALRNDNSENRWVFDGGL